ncbi:MAG: hypothetical protein AB7N71_00085 [Phycisphaerae bacterium]
MTKKRWQRVAFGCGIWFCLVSANAQDIVTDDAQPDTQQSVTTVVPEVSTADSSSPELIDDLTALPVWPSFNRVQFAWIGVLGILAITLMLRRGSELAALDGLLLAFAATCMLLRSVHTTPDFLVGHDLSWWTYLALLAIVVYFAVRGMFLLGNQVPDQVGRSGNEGAAFVFLVAAILFGTWYAKNVPPAQASVDGLLGGRETMDFGTLPYGTTSNHNHRSPLLYLWYASLAKMDLVNPLPDRASEFEFERTNFEVRTQVAPYLWYSARPILWSNLFFAGLTLIGLMVIGSRLHSASVGLSLAALFALFPGTLDAITNSELLLGTALLTWAIAFSLLPLLGGFFGALFFVAAGFVWPWAWLGLPILLAYSWVRGWMVVWSIFGFLAGVGLFVWALPILVPASLPQPRGFWSDSAEFPRYAAAFDPEQLTLTITPMTERQRTELAAEPHTFAPMIDWLLRQGSTTIDRLASTSFSDGRVVIAEGVDPHTTHYAAILPVDELSRSKLQAQYQFDMSTADPKKQFMGSLRTLIEDTWRPGKSPYSLEQSAWRSWGALEKSKADQIRTIRRVIKTMALVLAALCSVILLSRKAVAPPAFVGALLAVLAVGFIASLNGPGDHWAWILPAMLAAHAATRPRLPAVSVEGYSIPPAYPVRR